ncbi:hypothetical protein ACTXT7_006852 [Hymenolepis weldensis]
MTSSCLLFVAAAMLVLVNQTGQATRISPEEEAAMEEILDFDGLEGPFFVDRRGFLTSSRLGRRKKGFLSAGRLGR